MTDSRIAEIRSWLANWPGPLRLMSGDKSIPNAHNTAPDHVRFLLEDREALLAAVRERDNTIARVREVLDDYDGLDAEPIPKLSTHAWMHEVRAALDPQETP